MDLKKREVWIDIAKGLSIIFVVMGHSGDVDANHYLSWFRMPLFFILSGLLFKPINPKVFLIWAKKRSKKLIIPYFSYGILITIVFSIFNPSIGQVFKNLIKLLYGGVILTGPYGVFWFITCLLLTQLLFGYLSRFSMKTQLIVIVSSYIISHVMGMSFMKNIPFPGNADVVLLTLTYYSLGFYAKKIINIFIKKWPIIIITSSIWILFILLDMNGIYEFTLDLKNKIYQNVLLDFFIPVIIAITISSCCYLISKFKFLNGLSYFGKNSITIMYLHIPINLLVKEVFQVEYGLVVFTIIGVSVSLVASFFFDKSKILSSLFLGKELNRKNSTNFKVA